MRPLLTLAPIACAVLLACGSDTGPSASIPVKPTPETALAVGGSHVCVLTSAGAAWCWGRNNVGQLGDGTGTTRNVPAPVSMPTGVTFTQISAASSATCALSTTGDVYCWGTIPSATSAFTQPSKIPGGLRVQSISVGSFGVCLLDITSAAYCFGSNAAGQLGTGDSTSSATPRVVSGGIKFKSISSGLGSTCALTEAGTAYCWGSNAQRTLGIGATATNSPVPVAIQANKTFTSLSTGATLSCGIVAGGSTFCWGQSYFGSGGFGVANEIAALPPVDFPVPTALAGTLLFKSIAPGTGNDIFDATCGLTLDGTAYCWGINSTGALGSTTPGSVCQTASNGPFPCTNIPIQVSTSEHFLSLYSGAEVVCGISTTHNLLCWGYNLFGQIGDGTNTNRPSPVLIQAGWQLP